MELLSPDMRGILKHIKGSPLRLLGAGQLAFLVGIPNSDCLSQSSPSTYSLQRLPLACSSSKMTDPEGVSQWNAFPYWGPSSIWAITWLSVGWWKDLENSCALACLLLTFKISTFPQMSFFCKHCTLQCWGIYNTPWYVSVRGQTWEGVGIVLKTDPKRLARQWSHLLYLWWLASNTNFKLIKF